MTRFAGEEPTLTKVEGRMIACRLYDAEADRTLESREELV
jgi:hypothetical protein